MQQGENIASLLADFGQELAAARGEQGLSQAELAQRCSLKWQQITFFEAGGRIPSLKQLLTISRTINLPGQQGFPGGCPGKEDLAAFVKRVKKPVPERWDDLGRPAHEPPTSPLWKRWRINYAADLATFRQRAEGLVSLAKAEGRESLVQKG